VALKEKTVGEESAGYEDSRFILVAAQTGIMTEN